MLARVFKRDGLTPLPLDPTPSEQQVRISSGYRHAIHVLAKQLSVTCNVTAPPLMPVPLLLGSRSLMVSFLTFSFLIPLLPVYRGLAEAFPAKKLAIPRPGYLLSNPRV